MKSLIFLGVSFVFFFFISGCGNIPIENMEAQLSSSDDSSESRIMSSIGPQGFEEGDYYGLLNIEDIGMHLPTYCADISGIGAGAQSITDREDSAAVFCYGQHLVIADHDYQGFDKLLEVVPGTGATITLANGTEEVYECTSTAEGYNIAEIFLQMDTLQGEKLSGDESKEVMNLFDIEPSYLVMYTCHDSVRDIYITLWKTKES